jgi:hypothetical protein
MALQTPSPPPSKRDEDIEAGVIDDARDRQRQHRAIGAAAIVAALIAAGLIIGFAGGGGGSGSGGGSGHELGGAGAPVSHQALSAPKPALLTSALRRCDKQRPAWNGTVRPFAHGLTVSAANGRYVGLVASGQGGAHVCVIAVPPSGYLPDGGGQGLPIAMPGAHKLSDEGGGSMGGLAGAVWYDYGRAGRDVTSVEFVFAKHPAIEAVLHNGWYLAVVPDGNDRGLQPSSVRVTTSAGTVTSPPPGAKCNSGPSSCLFVTQPAPVRQTPTPVGRPVPNGPAMKHLLANLAILRRPQSAADRSWKPPCDCGSTVQVRNLTRLATTLPNNNRVFLDVKQAIAGGGQTLAPGSYILSLNIVARNGNTTTAPVNSNGQNSTYPLSIRSFARGGGPLQPSASPQAFATVVPDGVATVKWTIVVSCPKVAIRLGRHCPKPGTQTVTVPVTNNVAAQMLPGIDSDPFYARVSKVVWLSQNGRVIRSINS